MSVLDPRLSQGAAVLAAVMTVTVSWRFGYDRAVQRFRQDRAEVAALTARIAQVNAVVEPAGGTAKWLADNQRRLAALRAKFPQQEQMPQLLNALVNALKTGEVNLVNMTQGNLESVQVNNAPLLIEGVPCYRLSVTVNTEGRYHAVLAALDRLMDDTFPAIVSIEQVDLHLKDAAGATLEATVHLHLYVTGFAPASSPHA